MSSKIAVTLSSFAACNSIPLDMLKERKFDIVVNTLRRKMNAEEILKICDGCVGIVAGTEVYSKDILEKLSTLKVISRCGGGMDNIDRNATEQRGIKLFNTPEAPTIAVAELTVGFILDLLRKVTLMHTAVLNGKWDNLMGNLLLGKKVGIIGFGRIGRRVAELLKPFRCEVAYADSFLKDGAVKDIRRMSKEELLGWADIISIHVSGKDKLLGEREFRTIKKGAWLVNTSRGGVIDESALYQALKNGYFSGAALDVFEEEPYRGPLRKLSNIILTPHIGSYARESRIEMEKQAVLNLLKGLEV